jgi:hypothetical protein
MKRVWKAAVMVVAVGSMVPVTVFGTVPHEDGAEPLLIDGEQLKFEILYGSIPAGHAWLEVKGEAGDDGEIFRITSTALSNDVISVFFRVEDRIESVVDASTFEPRYFEKRLEEGPFRKHERAYYDAGLMRLGEEAVEIEPGTMDILSALYYVRGQDLRVGEDVVVRTFDGGKCYDARVKVLRKESVRTPERIYDCVVVEPELVEGPFAKTGKILIWLTDDALKVPVMMKSRVKVGSFVARLVGSTHAGGES